MSLSLSKVGLAALMAVSLNLAAQPAPAAKTLSTTELLVQSMGMASVMQDQTRRLLALPNHAKNNAPQVLALEQKMINLPESALVGVIARALDSGLPASDVALFANHNNSALGKKLTDFTHQAEAAAARDKMSTATAHLSTLMQTLSPDERQALAAFADSGVTERLMKFVESKTFEQALLRELSALPESGR